MKKKKEERELKRGRIFTNNIFALKLLWKACPAKMVFTVVTTLTGIALGLASLYIIRYGR